MKHSPSRWFGLLHVSLAILILAGCSNRPTSRIDANRALYESWPVEIQSAVLDGRAVKDMTPAMVRMALGEPTRIEPRSGYDKGEETWIYVKSSGSGLSLPNIGLGGSIGGVGVSSGGRRGGGSRGSGGPSGAEEIQVVFQKGVVTSVN